MGREYPNNGRGSSAGARREARAFLHELDHAWSDWKLWSAPHVPVKYPDAMDPDPAELDEDGPSDTPPPTEEGLR